MRLFFFLCWFLYFLFTKRQQLVLNSKLTSFFFCLVDVAFSNLNKLLFSYVQIILVYWSMWYVHCAQCIHSVMTTSQMVFGCKRVATRWTRDSLKWQLVDIALHRTKIFWLLSWKIGKNHGMLVYAYDKCSIIINHWLKSNECDLDSSEYIEI